MTAAMDGPNFYAIAEPLTLIAALLAMLAGCAWLSVAAMLRKGKGAAIQTSSLAGRLEISALLTGVTLITAALNFFLA